MFYYQKKKKADREVWRTEERREDRKMGPGRKQTQTLKTPSCSSKHGHAQGLAHKALAKKKTYRTASEKYRPNTCITHLT